MKNPLFLLILLLGTAQPALADVQNAQAALDKCKAEIATLEAALAAAEAKIGPQEGIVDRAATIEANYRPENSGETSKSWKAKHQEKVAELEKAKKALASLKKAAAEAETTLKTKKAECKTKTDALTTAKEKAARDKKSVADKAKREADAEEAKRKAAEACRNKQAEFDKEQAALERKYKAALSKYNGAAIEARRRIRAADAMISQGWGKPDQSAYNKRIDGLTDVATRLDSDLPSTLVEASLPTGVSMANTIAKGIPAAWLGAKIIMQYRQVVDRETLCLDGGQSGPLAAKGARYLVNKFKITEKEAYESIKQYCEDWAGRDNPDVASEIQSSLQEAITHIKTIERLRGELKALQDRRKKALPAPSEADEADCSDADTGEEEAEEISDTPDSSPSGETTDKPIDDAKRPVTGSGSENTVGSSEYRGSVPASQTVSGSGRSISEAIETVEGGIDVRIQHSTDSNNAYASFHVEVDTNRDGTFCGDGDSGCRMVHQAAYDDIKQMDTTVSHDWYFYGGAARFNVDAPGDWQITVTPDPRPRHRLTGTVSEQLVRDGIVYDQMTGSSGTTVTATSARGEVFRATTDWLGGFEMIVWGDTDYSVTAEKGGYASGTTSVPESRFKELDNRARAVEVGLQLHLAQ